MNNIYENAYTEAVNRKEAYVLNKTERNHVALRVAVANLEYAITNEMFPQILEVINKYENKRIGSKTEEKIENEIFEKFNVRISFNRTQDIVIFTELPFQTLRTIQIYSKYDTANKRYYTQFVDGKLVKLTPDMYSITTMYVEDIDTYVDKKLTEMAEIVKAKAELDKMLEAYKSDLVHGLNRPYITINDGLTVVR